MTTARKIKDRGDVSELTRQELEERLKAAEDVCVMYGWCGAAGPRDGNRELAALELWTRWAHIVGSDATGPKANVWLDKNERALAEQGREDLLTGLP